MGWEQLSPGCFLFNISFAVPSNCIHTYRVHLHLSSLGSFLFPPVSRKKGFSYRYSYLHVWGLKTIFVPLLWIPLISRAITVPLSGSFPL